MKNTAKLAYPLDSNRTYAKDHPPIGGIWKRGFDIAVSVAGLIMLSPLFLMIALLVKFADGGTILYAHRRIGLNGEPFHCLKFRTMVEDGDWVLADYLRRNSGARDEWYATRKLQNDPRVTRTGSVLRRFSIDELPQLINILHGDMSFVGPRPVVKDELEIYGRAADCYLRSRPGLTGLWQVSGRNDVSYEARVAFDRHYVEHWSFAADARIILQTISAVLRGSY